MNYIWVVNSGSSSLKCSLFKGDTLIEEQNSLTLPNVPIAAIGHRIVHGGKEYKKSTIITEKVVNTLEALIPLAPLHNGPAVDAIKACQKMTTCPQVAVFDTAFFREMPQKSRLYAIDQAYGIERFGFHGISHAYLWQEYARHTGRTSDKIITLHLGAGCSATAINAGRPIDTSMGFTPNEGLVMATRSGNIDPFVVEYLSQKEQKPTKEIIDILNSQSGLLGLSKCSSDMKRLLAENSPQSLFAIELFCYRIVQYIGAYIAALNGIDAIIFSAGIGENAPLIRKKVCEQLSWFGILLDNRANEQAKPPFARISQASSKIAIYMIKTEENRKIAQETVDIAF